VFLPHMVWLREYVAGGGIGELRLVQADFGFRTDFDPNHRLFDPDLGGGALLDVGLYPLALAQALLGPAAEVSGYATIGSTGVDEEVVLSLRYRGGQLASVTTATRLDTPNEAWLLGTEGRIRLHREWWRPSPFTIYRDGTEEVLTIRAELPGHNYQVLEVNRCVREGLQESPVVPWDFTRALAATLDTALAQ
jgi:predicted dehydrogenase